MNKFAPTSFEIWGRKLVDRRTDELMIHAEIFTIAESYIWVKHGRELNRHRCSKIFRTKKKCSLL